MSLVIKKILNNLRNIADSNKIITGQETATNEYIDGKKVYRKRLNCGTLANAGNTVVAHGLSNVTFVKIEGIARVSNVQCFPIPYSSTSPNYSITVGINSISVTISTGIDRTNCTAFIDLYYTKN